MVYANTVAFCKLTGFQFLLCNSSSEACWLKHVFRLTRGVCGSGLRLACTSGSCLHHAAWRPWDDSQAGPGCCLGPGIGCSLTLSRVWCPGLGDPRTETVVELPTCGLPAWLNILTAQWPWESQTSDVMVQGSQGDFQKARCMLHKLPRFKERETGLHLLMQEWTDRVVKEHVG